MPGRGEVYAIGGPTTPLVKIGFTAKPVLERLVVFQFASPAPLEVLWAQPGTADTERALHEVFANRRHHGEWFDFSERDATHEIHSAYWSRMASRGFPYGPVDPPDRCAQECAIVLYGRAS